ncbi:hypothetical protein [Haloglycomyces albus]|uniref:hypothetical protein n=1 Tax=Haloglycomyces albus TaxID=526067 RepID=UPI0004A28E86|nr:hypothetical protein [Haloglycomyces albus]
MNFDQLDQLSTEELQSRAFALARSKGDWRFFLDIMRHTSSAAETEDLNSDLAEVGSIVDDLVGMWREATRGEWGSVEPMARADFIDYLMRNAKDAPSSGE